MSTLFLIFFTLVLFAFFYATIFVQRWIESRFTLSKLRKRLLDRLVALILSAIFTILIVLLLYTTT